LMDPFYEGRAAFFFVFLVAGPVTLISAFAFCIGPVKASPLIGPQVSWGAAAFSLFDVQLPYHADFASPGADCLF